MGSGRLSLIPFLVLLMTMGAALANAQNEPSATVEKSHWNIGVSRLVVSDPNDSGLQSAAGLIARLIHDGISGLDEHTLSSEQRILLAENLIDTKKRNAYRSLASLHESRDAMFFDPNTGDDDIRAKEVQIDEAKAELDSWLSASPTSIAVPQVLPLSFPGSVDQSGLWDLEDTDPAAYMEKYGLDSLVAGDILRVGDYYGLKLVCHIGIDTHVLWEGAVDEAHLEQAAEEAGDQAKTLILGRPWSSVAIASTPPETTISINGTAVGVGLWSDSDMEPGSYTVEFSAPGHHPVVRELILVPMETVEIVQPLDVADQPSILVMSEPPGADVRLGSIWLGVSPLAVKVPDRVMSLTFEKEGFRRRTVPFYPDAERLTVPLENALIDPVAELDTARRKLHAAMAWFSVSLAPTVLLLGLSQNYLHMAASSSTAADFQTASDAYYLTYGLMWGSVGINALLLTNVFFKLARYLKAAEGLSER